MKLTQLKGISEKKEALFFKLGLCTVEDLISFFPKSYMDLSQITTLDEAILKEKEERILVCIEVVSIARIPNKRNLSFIRVKIKDSFATAYLNIFGDQPYYRKIFKEGKKFLLSGLFRFQNGKIECSQFSVEKALEDVADISNYNLKDDLQSLHYQRIVPIYSLTPGLTQKFLRESIFGALDKMKERLSENLPAYLTQKYKFIKRDEAFKEIHFPTSFEKLEQAKKRFKYYELFKLQFQFGLKRHYFKAMGAKSQKYLNKKELYHKVIESLPFKLTSSQIKALEEIHTDLYKDSSMHRLLLGDVGSGKTLVAILSALTVIESGYQAVFLVPTEALAYQHFLTVMKLFSPFFINVRLLTGSTKSGEKKEILKDLNNNECSFLIGTHAVFTHDVEYKNLALIIIDEQHKFGVNQRAKLVEKTFTPDLLIMSATPIPRTLGYSIFGDLDISRLNEKPQGRETIQTFWYTKDSINEVYTFIQKQIEKGHQGYMVYPLIEESETTDLNSLLNSYEQLKKGPLSSFSLGILHGKMTEEDKKTTIKKFHNKEIDILLSTTIIEVGIDVKNATFIIIREAQRFGLSTLHQLRGRVGRSDLKSYCILVTPNKTSLAKETSERMQVIQEEQDGFIIAQKDLELRGTGKLLGTQQKGHSGLRFASLIYDEDLLEKARADSFAIIERDPFCNQQENAILKPFIKKFEKEVHSLLYN